MSNVLVAISRRWYSGETFSTYHEKVPCDPMRSHDGNCAQGKGKGGKAWLDLLSSKWREGRDAQRFPETVSGDDCEKSTGLVDGETFRSPQ